MYLTSNPNRVTKGCVLTIGNFDGVHLGHQQIIRRVKEQSELLQLPSVVIVFEPQPLEFFRHRGKTQSRWVCPSRLTNLCAKLEVFAKYEIDTVLCLRFNEELASLTAKEFVETILLEKLQARYVVVGDNFCFGRDRIDGYRLLQQYADKLTVEEVAQFEVAGHRVSSTLVRRSLADSNFALVERLLGRPYGISGRVAHGDKRGRLLGFPTANIFLHQQQLSLNGVFIAKVLGLRDSPLLGVANIGRRPTVDALEAYNQLEVHILDFAQDIYGKRIRVEFARKIRDEVKFSSLDALKQQIGLDTKKAEQYE